MNAEDWSRVKSAFHAAVEMPAGERPAFLDALCGDDRALRREVESLLAGADDADCAIERQAAQMGGWLGGRAVAAGRRVGAYEIVRELGRGGMGTVYLARRADGQYRHDVALKMIRRTLSAPDLESRFRRERQILASLAHPNIARLLDGGVTDEGEPYLVMEYLAGEPLLEFAARRRLDARGRVAIVLQVCRAVAYAHGRLVVHRDIKPSNVLVTADGEPKLVDFGLARILDDTLTDDGEQTQTAFRAFTPSYAPPEQILGHAVSTATDVYALGVLLYELLTGAPPFNFGQSGIAEILRVLETAEPARPSEAVQTRHAKAGRPAAPCLPAELGGDLDNIVLMAIRRMPDQRYESVAALAADLERYLAGRPVLARPQTWRYRAGKFARRHAVGVAASALVAVALAATLVFALWQADVARAERDRAARRFNDVRRLSNALLFDIGPKVERLPGAIDAREALLGRAVDYLDRLAAESADDLTLVAELAAAYEKVGDLQGNPTNPNLVELDGAIASYRKARTLRERVRAAAASPEAEEALAENRRVLGTILAQANEFEAADRELAAALTAYDALAAREPADPALARAVARTRHDVGRNLSNTKRYDASLAYFAGAIAAAERLRLARPDDLETLALLADSHAQRGLALSWEGRQREAEAEMDRAAALYEPAVRAHPDDVSLAAGLWSTYWLTSSVYEEQDDVRSHAFAMKALDVARAALARDPANIRARQQLAKALSRAGQTSTNTNRPDEAVRYLEESTAALRAITSREVKNGRLSSELALALTRLAEARLRRGEADRALGDAEEAAEIYRAVTEATAHDKRSVRNLVLTRELIGDIHRTRKSSRQAQDSYGEAVTLLERLRDEDALAAVDAAYLQKLRAKAAAGAP
jgi:non-specific serine/threonine protein kinase/serine/threonine-protein kinase